MRNACWAFSLGPDPRPAGEHHTARRLTRTARIGLGGVVWLTGTAVALAAPGVSITESGGSTDVDEAGPTSDTYTIVLGELPTADVEVVVDPDEETDVGAGGGSPILLTFAVDEWDTPQTVTVTAVDDGSVEGSHTSTITHTASSDDPAYDGIAISDVVANITDNDAAGITINESGGSTDVSENGPTADSYEILLDSQPTAAVTITVTCDAQVDLGLGPGAPISIVIGPSSWSLPRDVFVTAVDDAVAEGVHTSTITHSAASGDPDYEGAAISDVVVNITDNDAAGAKITESGGSTNVQEEGPTSDTYTIELLRAPTADVTVTLDPDVETDLGAGAGTAIQLAFTVVNWGIARQVNVTAVDDAESEGPHTSTITHTASSADPDYDGLAIDDVVANVADNDIAGVTIVETDGSTDVDEAGPTADTYTVVLDSQPSADVTLTVDPDVQTDLGSGTGTAIDLTFTTGNWSTPQTVTVTAVDDAVAEGAHTSTITHTAASADVEYDGLVIADVVANVTDNEWAGISVTQSGGSTDVDEDGPTADTYTVVLDSEPTGDVTITVDPDGQTDLGSGAGTAIDLTFTTGNWSTPQTVTVTAVDDAIAEGAHTSTITHTASSADTDYDGIVIANVVANVTDDDTAGVTTTESAGSTDVDEAGPTADTYTVVLDSQPTGDVILTVDPDGQTDLGSGAGTAIGLTFTTGNWSTPQTVTVTAVDDAVAEGAHTSTITHTAASTDSNYDGIAIANVTANVTDNDTAGVTITETGGSTDVAETGPTSDMYNVVLDSQPTADVTLTIDPDGQTDLGSGAGIAIDLTFTSGNWDTTQFVTVTAVDDAVAEGAHTSTITHAAASADAGYDGVVIANVTANVTDNDTAGVTIAETGGSTDVDEAGPTADTYTVVLDSEPTAGVTLTVDPDGQTDLGSGAGTAIDLTFTSGNWDTPQTVTVTAVDDAVAEWAHTSTITHTAASADAGYDGIAIANVVANVTDNDTAGVTIAESGGSTDVDETGPTTDTYTIVLDSQPTADVTITADPDGQTDLGSGPGTAIDLTFTAGNWDTPQVVSVTAVDDAIDEGPHTSTISHSASSADGNYDAIVIADVVASVTDNDLPGVTITETGGSTDVDETGPTADTYTVVLDSQPTANVIISVDPDEQTDLGSGPGTAVDLTFIPGSWNTPQVVTATAVDDAVDEGAHTSTITHTAASADGDYDGIAIANVVANVTDNDAAGVTVTETGGSTDVNETGPTTDTYTIVLDSQPTADVTITVDPDEQMDVGAGAGVADPITFTTADWNVPRTVVATAVDDAVPEGPHVSTITHTAVSGDGNYDGRVIADVDVNIIDNDLAGVTITETGGSTDVDETGPTTDTYTVVLDSQPTGDVIITVDPDAQADLGSGAGTAVDLTFTGANWNTPQVVSVTAVDDGVDEGAHTSTITHTASSTDVGYDGIAIANVVADVADNDTAGVTVTETGGSTDVDETGPTADTYTIVLDSQPTANVTITVDPDTQTDLGSGAGTAIDLIYTAGNWSTPQVVTVTAVDDDLAEGAHTSTITHTAGSTDPNYDGFAIANVTANVTDNDTVGVTIAETGGSTDVDETGPTADTYTIVLDSQPTADVILTVDPDGQTDLGSGAGTAIDLTYTAGNWSTPQAVTVTAVDDTIAEGAHTSTITHTAASADGDYDGIAVANVVANVTDDDNAGVTIAETGGSTGVDETGPTADTYTVVLDSQPTADVTVTIDPDGQTDLGSGAGTAIDLTFTAGNWDTPRTVVVTAVDDADAEGPHTSVITHAVSSADADYDGLAVPDLIVDVIDNDLPGVVLAETSGTTSVHEQGPTSDTYTIVLTSPPTATATITVTPDAQVDLGAGAGTPVSVAFNSGNWNVPRTIVVTAEDDSIVEGPHTSTLTHSSTSADPDYDGRSISDIEVTVEDNDGAGVVIVETDESTQVTEGVAQVDTYTMSLSSQPSSDVTLTITPDAQSTVDPTELTFTSANWDTPQAVTVTAVDDDVAEENHTSTIRHTAASADGDYDGVAIDDLTADITDNDMAAVTITESAGSTDVTEGGGTDTYTVVLSTEPTANVVIAVAPDAQSTVDADELTFTAANWDTPQTVTVTAVDDDITEGSHTSTIDHTVMSADGQYDGLTAADVTASVADNDTACVTFTESDGSTDVAEGGATDTYAVVLNTQPTANVVIAVAPDAQSTVDADELTFTAANWDTPQTVTVTAVDDDITEGAHTSTIDHTVMSADGEYDGLAAADVTASIADNDTACVTFTESDGSTDVTEGGTADTYAVVLNTQPTANVVIAVTPDAQSMVDSDELTFTAANWDTPQTVTVTAVNDDAVEGAHTSTIAHSAASDDTDYDGVAIDDVTVNVTDDDTAGVTITESEGSTDVDEEGPTSDTYTVVLNSEPEADVAILVAPDEQTDVGAGPGVAIQLDFSPADWSVIQIVTVTAVDDTIVEGLHTSTITHEVESEAATYDGVSLPAIAATVLDNDVESIDPEPVELDESLIADAGTDITVYVGDIVTLDGSGSSSTDEAEIIDYIWDLTSDRTRGLYTRGVVAEWVFEDIGEYVVTLTVEDDRGTYAEDTVVVTVLLEPLPVPLPTCGATCGPLGLSNIVVTLGPLIAIRAARPRSRRPRL